MQLLDHRYSNLRLSTDFFVFNSGIIRVSAGLAGITSRMMLSQNLIVGTKRYFSHDRNFWMVFKFWSKLITYQLIFHLQI